MSPFSRCRPFADRVDAGRQLATALSRFAGGNDLLVLALPRGGVPVAAEVATALGAPLDVLIVRKLGIPGHKEVAMGALASGGIQLLRHDLIRDLGIREAQVNAVIQRETIELTRRERLYREARPQPDIAGNRVMLVDDGIATGATMMAAIAFMREQHASRIVVAVPVGPRDSSRKLGALADEVIVLWMPARFSAVGEWYEEFPQVSDGEVRDILATGPQPRAGNGGRQGCLGSAD